MLRVLLLFRFLSKPSSYSDFIRDNMNYIYFPEISLLDYFAFYTSAKNTDLGRWCGKICQLLNCMLLFN